MLIIQAVGLFMWQYKTRSCVLKMLDAIFYLLSEVIFFHLGRFSLGVFTLGRYKPKLGDTSQPLVSLFGGLIAFVLVIGIAIALRAP